MIRCWNCGLADVGERCPRCGAPQERRGSGGAQPPAAPPTGQSGGLRPPPEFIVNGVPVDPRAPNSPSGPLPPPQRPRQPGYSSGQLPSQGTRPPGYQSGPLPPERLPGRTSGPLPPSGAAPPGGGYRRTRPTPEGWDEEMALPPEPPRGSGLLSRRGSAPLNGAPPAYEPQDRQRAEPPLRPPTRPATGPIAPGRHPQGDWDEEAFDAHPSGFRMSRGASAPIPQQDYQEEYNQSPASPTEKRVSEPLPYAPEKIVRQRPQERPASSYALWDNDDGLEWDQPEFLTLSGIVNALIGAAIGALFGGLIWIGITFASGLSLPYLTVLVGLLAGLGARFTLEQTRPWSLGIFAGIGVLVGFVIAQYGLFDYALAEAQLRQGLFNTWFPLSPLQFISVYWDYLINVADDVNRQLGQLGPHPEAYVEMLVCVVVCWAVLIRRKQ